MKKVWRVISTCLMWVITIAAVCMMLFTIISVNTFDRNDRELFGYRFYIVLSDSMSATDFDAGDVVAIKRVDPTVLVPGDIISYTSQDPSNYGTTVTHKIRTRTVTEKGEPAFITYGTSTDTNDATPVTYPFVLGQYQFRIPKVGVFFQYLKTTQGYIVCILLPFLVLILYQALNTVRSFNQYKKAEMAELKLERDKLEEQRRKSEEMMEQLLTMRREMQAAPPAPDSEQSPDVAAMLAQIDDLKAQLEQAKNNKGGKMIDEENG